MWTAQASFGRGAVGCDRQRAARGHSNGGGAHQLVHLLSAAFCADWFFSFADEQFLSAVAVVAEELKQWHRADPGLTEHK